MDAILEREKKYQTRPKVIYRMLKNMRRKNTALKSILTMYDAPNVAEKLKRPRKIPQK